jgi:hypothetical protein
VLSGLWQGDEVPEEKLPPVRSAKDVADEVVESDEPEPELRLPELDPRFWETYPVLSRVRDFAYAAGGSPEALLGAVLARVAALVRRGTCVDTGMLTPVTLSFFTALVGVSGRGKSTAIGLARTFLPYTGERWLVAEYEGQPAFAERDLGTGEGLLEVFIGSVLDRSVVGAKGGRPPRVRRQVRSNALLVADEGGALVTELARQGAKFGPIVRSTWNGTRAGTQNGTAETTRDVRDFALGVIVGFQPRPASVLFGEELAELGMPQRFWWVPARTSWPAQRPDCPGPLEEWEPPAGGTVLRPPNVICERLYREYEDDRPRPLLDSQRPAMLSKLAGLITILRWQSDRVVEITETDWLLAEHLYALNVAVRQALADHAAEQAEREERHKRDVLAARAVHSRRRVESVNGDIVRIVRRLERKVARIECEENRPATKRELQQFVTSRDRHLFDDALVFMVRTGRIEQRDGEAGFRLSDEEA